jgi:beta-lactam-binding protein with PASTA domain
MLVVPNLLGQPMATAQARLTNAGLGSETSEDFSRDVPRGSVASQDPQANAQLEQGKTVRLVISRGPQRVPVPNVVGLVTRDATAELTGRGFVVKPQQGFNTRAVDTVFEQRPAAGEQVDPGAEITILVSQGRDIVVVPPLRGLTEEAARQQLAARGLVPNVSYVPDSSVQNGQVSSHSPTANTEVDRGSAVIVAVARAGASAPTQTAPPATATRPAATATAAPARTATPGGTTGSTGGR